MMQYRTSRQRRQHGAMLFIVVVVVAVLTLSGTTLLFLMKTERDATRTRSQELELTTVSRSAVTLLQGLLELPPQKREEYGGIYDNAALLCASSVLTPNEGGEGTLGFTVVSPKYTDDDKLQGLRYGLVNESSRLNLAAVLQWDQEKAGAGRTALMRLPGMTSTMADSILDWIDADEKTRTNGAEASYYSRQKLPYSPRNALPVFLEELLLVRDVTRRHLFGSDDKFNYNIDSPSDGKLPWSQLLTVFSAEKDVTPEGEARTDLNGADLSFLYDELASRLDTQTAAFLVYYRQYGPATDQQVETARNNGLIVSDTAAMTTLAGSKSDGATEAKPDCTLPAAFTLKTPLDVVGASVLVPVSPTSGTGSDAASTVSSEPQYRLITSPITVSRGDSKKLFRFLDYASTSPGTVIIGRVNINEAPRTVLEAIPDLTRSDVQQILSSRPSPENGIDDDHRHAAWLYTKGIVNLEKMKGLWNKITTGGDVYRGQVIGFLDKNLASNRAEIVLDNTVSPPRQVFHKDLTAYGAGFPNEILLGTQSEKNKPIGDFSPAVTNGYFELDLPKPNSNPFSDIDGQIKNDNNSRMNSGQNTPRNTLSGIDLNDTADTLLSDQARNTGPVAVSQTGNRNRTAGKQDVPPSVSDSNADGMPDETGIPGISGMPETGGQTMDGTGNGQLSAADGDSETGLTRNQRLINALQERRQKRNANKSPTE